MNIDEVNVTIVRASGTDTPLTVLTIGPNEHGVNLARVYREGVWYEADRFHHLIWLGVDQTPLAQLARTAPTSLLYAPVTLLTRSIAMSGVEPMRADFPEAWREEISQHLSPEELTLVSSVPTIRLADRCNPITFEQFWRWVKRAEQLGAQEPASIYLIDNDEFTFETSFPCCGRVATDVLGRIISYCEHSEKYLWCVPAECVPQVMHADAFARQRAIMRRYRVIDDEINAPAFLAAEAALMTSVTPLLEVCRFVSAGDDSLFCRLRSTVIPLPQQTGHMFRTCLLPRGPRRVASVLSVPIDVWRSMPAALRASVGAVNVGAVNAEITVPEVSWYRPCKSSVCDQSHKACKSKCTKPRDLELHLQTFVHLEGKFDFDADVPLECEYWPVSVDRSIILGEPRSPASVLASESAPVPAPVPVAPVLALPPPPPARVKPSMLQNLIDMSEGEMLQAVGMDEADADVLFPQAPPPVLGTALASMVPWAALCGPLANVAESDVPELKRQFEVVVKNPARFLDTVTFDEESILEAIAVANHGRWSPVPVH